MTDMTAFQGLYPTGLLSNPPAAPSSGLLGSFSQLAQQMAGNPTQGGGYTGSSSVSAPAQQPALSGLLGPYSQLAYQMAGSPKQGGAYAPVAAPPGVGSSGGSAATGAASGIGGVLTGLLGSLAKNPQIVNSISGLLGNNGLSSLLPTAQTASQLSPVGLGAASDAATSSANEAAQALGGSSVSPLTSTLPGSTSGALSGYPIAPSGNGILGAASPLLDQTGLGADGLASVGVGAAQTAADSSAAEAAQALGGAGSSGTGLLGSGLSGTQALGAVAIPLSLYNEVNSWQSGATGSDALSGAASGAAIGTAIMPGIGTAIGALGGAAAGAISSLFGNGKVDPENANFNQYTHAFNSASPAQQQQVAAAVTNPYVALAGYFDLRPDQVGTSNTIYGDYGRQGEGKFTNALISQVQKGQSSGITDSTQMWNQVISPWLSSQGSWSGGSTANSAAMTSLVQNMTGQIMAGTYKQNFKATGGDTPFSSGTWQA